MLLIKYSEITPKFIISSELKNVHIVPFLKYNSKVKKYKYQKSLQDVALKALIDLRHAL